jgi:TonB family protein
MSARGLVVMLALLGVACSDPATPPSRVEARPRKPVENPPPPPKTEAEIAAVTRELVSGPAFEASTEDRRAAVLALLTDGHSAEHLSLEVTDPGVEFDPFIERFFKPPYNPFGSRRQPQVRHGKLTVEGDGELDPDVIRRIVRAHIQAIRACYTKALEPNPVLQGRLTVEFEINEKGRVEHPAIGESTIDSDSLESCVLEAAGHWRFPAPKRGAVTVAYPFVLSSGG